MCACRVYIVRRFNFCGALCLLSVCFPLPHAGWKSLSCDHILSPAYTCPNHQVVFSLKALDFHVEEVLCFFFCFTGRRKMTCGGIFMRSHWWPHTICCTSYAFTISSSVMNNGMWMHTKMFAFRLCFCCEIVKDQIETCRKMNIVSNGFQS